MSPLSTLKNRIDKLAPGVICAAVIAIAAMFLSEHYGASAMLFALLLGMALNFLGQEGKCVSGIQFAASTVLQSASHCWACVSRLEKLSRWGRTWR